MFDTQYHAIKAQLQQATSIMISAHVGPDGDTLGSMLGLKHALLGYFPNIQRIDCLIAGKMPDIYRFMPGIEAVCNVETALPGAVLPHYDLAISVDCGAIERLGPNRERFETATQSLNIDHHISNQGFAQINLIDIQAAASAEVVADLLSWLGIALTTPMASCLYVGLMTDTGGFKYKNSTPKVFQLAGQLVAAGADPELIYKHIYETRPYRQVQLHAHALSQLDWFNDKQVAIATITRDQLAQFGCDDEHLEGLVESIRQIDTVVLAGLLKETRQGTMKLSLRSDSHDLNVAELLAPLGGGGHKMAAGCTMDMPFETAKRMVLPRLQQALSSCPV
jgi:bifunctional oligoribonuclease and PAP phosphatase NrnA